MKNIKKWLKYSFYITFSIAFMFLAFQKVDLNQMIEAFKTIKIMYLFLIFFANLCSEWLRILRWNLFLLPIETIKKKNLFSALMISYAANTILPARLGEFLRAYILSMKSKIAASSIFATILIERLVDVFTVFTLMLFTLIFFPFPIWVKNSGYIVFSITLAFCFILFSMKNKSSKVSIFTHKILMIFPKIVRVKIFVLFEKFFIGFSKLEYKKHYLYTIFLSIFIWFFKGLVFLYAFRAFNFDLPWIAPAVLLIITAISVIIPSSPGYIGTYHWTCQIALGLFGISGSPALALAFVVHAMNVYPFFVIGLFYTWKEGVSLIGATKYINVRSVDNINQNSLS